MNLFDSSALLCFLRGEEGADVVERELLAGGACSAANWSEVAQKVAQREHDWRPARAGCGEYDDWYLAQFMITLNRGQNLTAVDTRQVEIQDDEIGPGSGGVHPFVPQDV